MISVVNLLVEFDQPTVLLVIDLQNDFLSKSGYLGRKGRNVLRLQKVIQPINKLISICRKKKYKIVFVRSYYDKKYTTPVVSDYIPPDMCNEDKSGSRFYAGVDSQFADKIFTKHTYDAFSNKKVEKYLNRFSVRNIVATGVFTNVCVESTVRSAFTRGFRVIVPQECVATYWESLNKSSLETINKYFGKVISLRQLIKKL